MTHARFDGPRRLLVALIPWLAAAAPLGPPASPAVSAVPAPEFRLKIEIFGAGKGRVSKIEAVCVGGVFYQFFSGAPEEVVVVEPGPRPRVTLIDLKERVQCQVLGVELDAHMTDLKKRLEAAERRGRESQARGDRVAAEMTRDLIAPKFAETFDADARTLRLENAVLRIDALGDPEPDPARLALIRSYLDTLTRFASLRVPDDLPPFGLLDAIDRLTGPRRLRPREISILVRVAGPPQRRRWSHELVPTLTDREREAVRRLDGLRATARLIPYRDYEDAH